MSKKLETGKKLDLSRTSYAEAVTEVKRLYDVAESAWVDLCLYLREIENTGLWMRGPDRFAQFGDFLRQHFPTTFGEEAYRNRITMIEGYGEQMARKLSPECSHAMTVKPIMEDPTRKQKMTSALDDHIKTYGVGPGVEVVRQLSREITRDVTPPRQPVRLASIEEAKILRSELAQAKLALKAMTKERDELAAKVVRLERQLERSKTGKSAKSARATASA